jgi:SAM-dependent methyltransferase
MGRRAINTSVRIFAECFDPPEPVVEVGSLCLPGAQDVHDLRPHFPGREYIGCDIRRGHGVDRIEDAQALTFEDGSVGTILLMEILEHLPRPQQAISEAHRVLRGDGRLVVSVPFNYRLHGFPSDYWRFTASGLSRLLQAFPDKMVFALGPRVKPAFIFGVAAKTADSDFVRAKDRFQSQIEAAFHKTRFRGHVSVFKERARDFFGHLSGRAELCASFFDPSLTGRDAPGRRDDADGGS